MEPGSKQTVGDQISRLLAPRLPQESRKRKRARRRAAIRSGFFRFLCHWPIDEVGQIGSEWRHNLASWMQRFADAREDEGTVRLDRRAKKAEALKAKRERIRLRKELGNTQRKLNEIVAKIAKPRFYISGQS